MFVRFTNKHVNEVCSSDERFARPRRCCRSTRAATTARSCCRPCTGDQAEPCRHRPRDRTHPRHRLRSVAELIAEGLVVEAGQREDSRPGKPATLLDLNRNAYQILGVDLSEAGTFRGAVLDLDGAIQHREQVSTEGATGEDATALVIALTERLVAAATLPILGLGVGSPGVVDLAGVVLTAPNLGWHGVALQGILESKFSVPVVVANDANAAALAEHSFGDADSDMMLIKIGAGVGAGLLLDGVPLFGSRFAAGEIGHVVVGTDGGAECVCGKHGCLETWLATPRLERALAEPGADREAVLAEAGQRLGIALAPVVGALNLAEVVLAGPTHLLDGTLASATIDTLRRAHDGRVPRRSDAADDHARRGHRHARRCRHGALRATRGLLTPTRHHCTTHIRSTHK